ncbi:hypothetical protein KFE25_008576 [Diacronema lutheri]|uniref:Malate dehydrogenase n=1 Tax=Diacronema lutheri TaxID=2081491 RepID=A0A8J5Y2E7_DIALT|nr:hypothetical protein KFE25_008576 [Diacronema lutheri]
MATRVIGRVLATVDVPIEMARSTTAAALRQTGWGDKEAAMQADIMVSAELCGNNQGLVKMFQPKLMAPAPGAAPPAVERDALASAVINANQSPGMLAALMAADLACDKVLGAAGRGGGSAAELPAIAIVGAYNSSTSSGQLAYYAEHMAKRGVVGICLANSPEFVAAAGGAKPVFGTNPMAVGIPTGAGAPPFVFDMATSAIALFGVLTAKAKGEPLPPGVAYGKDGKWTTNAAEALDGGAIATFGGHKGAGLALVIELLAGALSNAAVLGQCESKKAAKSWGHTVIAIRHEALVDGFGGKAASVLAAVKASGPSIRLPGESSARIAAQRRAAGTMPIPKTIWDVIEETARHGLK